MPLNEKEFAYLGNIFSMREEKGGDSAYFFDRPDSGTEPVTIWLRPVLINKQATRLFNDQHLF